MCFSESKVSMVIYLNVLEPFMFPAADKLYGEVEFIFQQDLAPTHTVKCTNNYFTKHGITVLT